MEYGDTPTGIRRVLKLLADKQVAEGFFDDVEDEIQLIFLDGSRLRIPIDPQMTEVFLEQTNGKGGWV